MSAESQGLDGALRETFDWYPVAKKEVTDAVRSRGLWVLTVVFTVLFVLPAAAFLYDFLGFQGGGRLQQQDLGMTLIIRQFYLNLVTILVPLVAIFLGYAAISKERASGSLKVLLSLPFSRRDVIVGKVLGRCAVAGATLSVALAVTAGFLAATRYTFKPGQYGLFVLFTVGFTVVMVAIAVSISGALPSTRSSLVVNFFVYFYFTFGWNSLANGLSSFLSNNAGLGGALRWQLTLFVKLLSPTQSYKTLLNSLLGSGDNAERLARLQMFSGGPNDGTICAGVLQGNSTTRQVQTFGNRTINRTVCQAGGDPVPLYFSDGAIFVYLIAWVGVAAAVSYYTFDRVDL